MTTGILHSDVLASDLDWAQEGWQEREFSDNEQVWAFAPSQGVATEERRWYRATVLAWGRDQYVTVRFDEARPDAPPAWQVGIERTLFRANIRTDLDALHAR